MKQLLKLAGQAIESQFNGKGIKISKEIKNKYSKKGACFVTLTEKGYLRGCIGTLQPNQPLYQDVIKNAINAGFYDYRFTPLEKKELKDIKIEISILSLSKKLEYKNEKELLEKINKDMGLILKYSQHSSTFLPQVWKQLPDKIEFLEHLSKKAGLDKNAWKNPETEIWYYRVEKIREN